MGAQGKQACVSCGPKPQPSPSAVSADAYSQITKRNASLSCDIHTSRAVSINRNIEFVCAVSCVVCEYPCRPLRPMAHEQSQRRERRGSTVVSTLRQPNGPEGTELRMDEHRVEVYGRGAIRRHQVPTEGHLAVCGMSLPLCGAIRHSRGAYTTRSVGHRAIYI